MSDETDGLEEILANAPAASAAPPESNETAFSMTPITPGAMLATAVARGAPLQLVEKLMDLQERAQKAHARAAFAAAISLAKGQIKPVKRDRLVDFTTSKGRTRYKYESFGAVAQAIDPVLAEHGLSYRFRIEQNDSGIKVTCIIEHRLGHAEENSMSAPRDDSGNKNFIQSMSSTVTYLKRITLGASLGLATTEDDDGLSSGGGGPQRITPEQVKDLSVLLSNIADTMATEKVLRFVQAERLEDITDTNFPRVLSWLRAKKQAETQPAPTNQPEPKKGAA